MIRLKLTLAYTGAAYAGWQIQAEGQGKSTIQKELETALSRIAGHPVRVHGAGRTDSGVHAEGQVAHADVPEKDVDWQRALNALLPEDIRVMQAALVSPEFHARYSATGKLYAYSIFMSAGPVPPRIEPYVWARSGLDLRRMEAVAEVLTGRHDFASFQNTGTPVADTVRTVWSIRCEKGMAGPLQCPAEWPVATWFFHGEGFLKQMVRNMVGLLVYAGLNEFGPEDARRCLAAASRQALPSATAPAKGLSLIYVEYPVA
ncbi:MAG: tRNA pseudouridine synthase A [Desulfovibrio sp.]